jgi:hypothetical protein
MGRRTLIPVAVATLCLAFAGAGPALADTGDIIAPQHSPGTAKDGWQAGVCNSDLPECSPESPALQYSTQAAAHPPVGFTQFIVKRDDTNAPVGILKDVRVDLPAGLSVNPQAAEQCALATFEAGALGCPAGAVVGTSFVTAALGGVELPAVPAAVYDLVPNQGEPALFAFEVLGSKVYLKTEIDWSGDYHEGFTIAVPESPIGVLAKNRLVFTGNGGNGTFLTNPSTCFDPAQDGFQHSYSTYLRADSVEIPNPSFPNGSSMFESPLPAGVKPTGCGAVPFKPDVSTAPGTSSTDSPAGAQVEVTVPFEPGAATANSNVQTASTSLPSGMGLNPSAADGLAFCSDAQLGKGTRNPVSCPANSKIGTISVQTPPLPANSLNGNVYLGKQLSRNPESGDEYRIFVDAESARYGISARLFG